MRTAGFVRMALMALVGAVSLPGTGNVPGEWVAREPVRVQRGQPPYRGRSDDGARAVRADEARKGGDERENEAKKRPEASIDRDRLSTPQPAEREEEPDTRLRV